MNRIVFQENGEKHAAPIPAFCFGTKLPCAHPGCAAARERGSEVKKAIIRFLRKHGWLNQARRQYRNLRIRLNRLRAVLQPASARRERFYRTFDDFVSEIEAIAPMYQQKTLLFHGFYLPDKRKDLIVNVSRQIAEDDPRNRVLLLNHAVSDSEAYRLFREQILPVDSLAIPDLICDPWSVLVNTPGVRPDDGMRKLMEEKPYLRIAIESAAAALPGLTADYAETLMCEAYRCYDAVLGKLNIAAVNIWCEFKYNHYLFTEMCRERGIPVSFSEFGSLPGTVVLDREGQMGESRPALHPEEFNELPVTHNDLDCAEKIVDYLKSSGINRREQPDSADNSELRARLKPGRPVILFAGQFDQDSGLVPYTENSRKYHSPVYRSTLEANLALAEIAERRGWNYIFKPHPMAVDEVRVSKLPKNVIYVDDININDIIDIADVVVTILSSTVYVSLVRDTASVMLGYNQIHGKGCAYEALRAEDVETVLCEAVEKGYTPEMRQAFLRHVARMQKYYLYNDCATRSPIRYGRDLKEAAAFFGEAYRSAPDAAVTNRRSLVVCDSMASVFLAVHLRASLPENEPVSLLVLSGGSIASACDFDRLRQDFSEVFPVDIDEWIAADSRAEKRPRLGGYTDLYLATISAAGQAAAIAALRENAGLRLHIADRGPLSSLGELRERMLREGVFRTGELEPVIDAVAEYLAPDIRGFARPKGRSVVLTPLALRLRPDEARPDELFPRSSALLQPPEDDVTVSQLLERIDAVESAISGRAVRPPTF